MAVLEVRNLSYKYPNRSKFALKDINISFQEGEFTVVCGLTGSGKTTLLRHLKPALTPVGECEGEVFYQGTPLLGHDFRTQTADIGFVMQNPDNQIITDKVWHELAFGLESLGLDEYSIRLRVAEMASFFGIEGWLAKNIYELSGGQKQLVSLASVMVMNPRFLILDEPTSQLDPIAATEFLTTVSKLNQDLGVGIILTEQRLDEVLPLVDRAVVMKEGGVLTQGTPVQIGKFLHEAGDDLFYAMPAPMRLCAGIDNQGEYPLTVKEGRKFLNNSLEGLEISPMAPVKEEEKPALVIRMRDVFFRYQKSLPDVISGLNLDISRERLNCIVGGNGGGKTTTLCLICGLLKPYRGKVYLFNKEVKHYANQELYQGYFGFLPQNPLPLFVKKSIGLDYAEMLEDLHITEKEKAYRIGEIAELMEIGHLLNAHPQDLSGGEQQKAALAKILLGNPEIILLDEPTKGMDGHFKHKLARVLHQLIKEKQITVIMASHDIEFCANYGDVCSLFFGGNIISSGEPHQFFAGNSFYTTAANRICRHVWPKAITVGEIIREYQRAKG